MAGESRLTTFFLLNGWSMLNVTLGLLVLLSSGCRGQPAGSELELGLSSASSEEVLFELVTRTRGCPVVGELFSVQIRLNPDRTGRLSGTWIVSGDPDKDKCFEPSLPAFGCVVEVPLEEKTVDTSEMRRLGVLFAAIPDEVESGGSEAEVFVCVGG